MSAQFTSYRADIFYIDQNVTVEAAAYSAGDLIGGKLTLAGAAAETPSGTPSGGGLIQSVIITDLAKQNITKDVVFFDANPSNTTFTENSALDIHDTDLLNIAGIAQVADWFNFGDNSVGQALNLAIPYVISGDTALYAAIIERGAPTYVSTSDLTIRVGLLPA